MMPYNPTVNDRSGEITAAYQMKTAEQDMQTQQFLGEKIGNVGTALAVVLAKKQEDASKATSIGEALNTMQATLPTYGPEGVKLQEIITQRMAGAGNNLDKMSGIYMAFQPAMQNIQSRFNQNAQYTQAINFAKEKASLGGGGGGSNPGLSVEVADGIDLGR